MGLTTERGTLSIAPPFSCGVFRPRVPTRGSNFERLAAAAHFPNRYDRGGAVVRRGARRIASRRRRGQYLPRCLTNAAQRLRLRAAPGEPCVAVGVCASREEGGGPIGHMGN